MTDRIPDSDELASAYLDGETTPAETARVEQNAALLARAEALRATRDAVSAPVPDLSAAHREPMIGAAVAAADGVLEPSGVVVSLRRFSWPPFAVAAAVALLAAVVGVGLLTNRLGGDEEAQMATEAPAFAQAADGGDVAAEAESAPLDSVADMESADSASPAAPTPMADDAEMEAEAPAAEMEAMEMSAETPDAEMEAAAEEAMAESGVGPGFDDEPAATNTVAEDALAADDSSAAPSGTTTGEDTPVVALGLLDSIDSLGERIADWREAQDGLDDAPAEGGACSEAVREQADGLGAEVVAAFVAALEGAEAASLDALLLQDDDGRSSILYAVEPDCAPRRLSSDETDGE